MTETIEKATVIVQCCPFCGEIPVMEPWHGGSPTKRLISCAGEDCFVSPQVTGETPNAAARNWNARAGAAAKPAQAIEG